MSDERKLLESWIARLQEVSVAAATLYGHVWKLEFDFLVQQGGLLESATAVEKALKTLRSFESRYGLVPEEDDDDGDLEIDFPESTEPGVLLDRFQRASDDQVPRGTTVYVQRDQLGPSLANYSPGDYFGRVFAVYGEPDTIDFGGFGYNFVDTQTRVTFGAFIAAGGANYQGRVQDTEILPEILQEFEQMIARTIPVDCEVRYPTRGGQWRCGYKDGEAFNEPLS